jgi:hypothetical protein
MYQKRQEQRRPTPLEVSLDDGSWTSVPLLLCFKMIW